MNDLIVCVRALACPNAGLLTVHTLRSTFKLTILTSDTTRPWFVHYKNMPKNPQEIRSLLMLLGQKGSAMFSSAVALGERNSLITLQTDPPLQQIDANRHN